MSIKFGEPLTSWIEGGGMIKRYDDNGNPFTYKEDHYDIITDEKGDKYFQNGEFIRYCGKREAYIADCGGIWVIAQDDDGLYRLYMYEHKKQLWDEFPYRAISVLYGYSGMLIDAVGDDGDSCWLYLWNISLYKIDHRMNIKKIGSLKIWDDEYTEFKGVKRINQIRDENEGVVQRAIIEVEPRVYRTLHLCNGRVRALSDKESSTFRIKRDKVIDVTVNFNDYVAQFLWDSTGKNISSVALKHPITGNTLQTIKGFSDMSHSMVNELFSHLGGYYDEEIGAIRINRELTDNFIKLQSLLSQGSRIKDIMFIRDYVIMNSGYTSDKAVWANICDEIERGILRNEDRFGNRWAMILYKDTFMMVYRRAGGDGVYLNRVRTASVFKNPRILDALYSEEYTYLGIVNAELIDEYNDLEKDRILRRFPIPNQYADNYKLGASYFQSVSIYTLRSEVSKISLTVMLGKDFSFKLKSYPSKTYTITNSDSFVILDS